MKCFKKKVHLLLWLFLLPAISYAQMTITGTVLDAAGETIIGANVVEQGTRNSTVTDANGKFTLSVQAGASIQVSFLGYSTQTVAAADRMTVILQESATVLDEMVVVGYASVKKVNLTGAVDQVRGDVLESRPITSVTQALQGMVGNLNISSSTSYGADGGGSPGARMSINIRGVTGLTGTNGSANASPLFVVDGIQSQDINAINPDDIASISVLKDAASAAIYGSNAPYGVVLITTKQGQKGAKPKITYNANFGFASPINLPTMLNSVEWAEMINSIQQHTNGSDFIPADAMQRIRAFYEGKIKETTVPEQKNSPGREWAGYDNDFGNDNIDWFDLFYKDRSFLQQHKYKGKQ